MEQLNSDTAEFWKTPMEGILLEIWSELLGEEISDVSMGFLEVGGDSIQAVRILSRVQDKFGVRLPLEVFFREKMTIARLCFLIKEAMKKIAEANESV